MVFKTKIGVEIEFHLIDEKGVISNSADLILKEFNNELNLIGELSKSMVEIKSDPVENLNVLSKNLSDILDKVRLIAKKNKLMLLPTTPISNEYLQKRVGSRYETKNKILGNKKRALELNICGTHIHLDKFHDLKFQHNVMLALDPLFAFMSSSSFLNGKNSLNNYRNKVYRFDVFKKFPQYGGLHGYVSNVDELNDRYKKLYLDWKNICLSKDLDFSSFNELNTYWGPIRMSRYTLESRSSDTNLLSNILALSAVYLGFTRQLDKLMSGEVPFDFPSFENIKRYELIAIKKGLKSGIIRTYLSQILEIAKNGLYESELRFLNPFYKMLFSGENFADELTIKAIQDGTYDGSFISAEGAAKLRIFAANRLEGDLNECIGLYE